MPRLTTVLTVLCVLLIPFVASASTPLLDPVTTYTNGMPLASTSPLRSHNVYYQCDPNHLGCCGGRYQLPCLRSLCNPNSCCTCEARSSGSWDGAETIGFSGVVDPTRFEALGSIPASDVGGPAIQQR